MISHTQQDYIMAKKNIIELQNPFICAGYVSPRYFCDRTEETEELIANMKSGRNTTLISPRRIGKTGLIKNAFYQLKRVRSTSRFRQRPIRRATTPRRCAMT